MRRRIAPDCGQKEVTDPSPSEAGVDEEKRMERMNGETPEEGAALAENAADPSPSEAGMDEEKRAEGPTGDHSEAGAASAESEVQNQEPGAIPEESSLMASETEKIPEGEALDQALAKAYRVYQDNVRETGNLIFDITIGARNGRPEKELLEMALEALGRCRLGTEGA